MSDVCQFRYKVTEETGLTESGGCCRHTSKWSLIQGEHGTRFLPFRIQKEKEKEGASTPQVNR